MRITARSKGNAGTAVNLRDPLGKTGGLNLAQEQAEKVTAALSYKVNTLGLLLEF